MILCIYARSYRNIYQALSLDSLAMNLQLEVAVGSIFQGEDNLPKNY